MKLLVMGLVGVIATLGGIAGTRHLMRPKPVVAVVEAYQHFKLEAVSVPILRTGKLVGYVIASASGSAKAKELTERRELVMSHLNAAAFRVIYGEPSFDFKELKPAQMQALAARMSDAANGSLGEGVVKDLVIETLNYMTPEEVRNVGR